MKLKYLGTAAAEGIPAVFCNCEMCRYARQTGGKEIRTRSGAIVDGVLKLDFPADAYMQSLLYGLDYSSLNHILITHTHPDHYQPEELCNRRHPFSQKKNTEEPLTVYGNQRAYDLIKAYLEEGVLEFKIVKAYKPVQIMDYTVTPLPAIHAFNENAFFYLIEKNGQALLYCHDTDEFTEEHLDFLKDKHLDMVSLDCTNGVLEMDYVGHMGISDNLRMREKLTAIGAADEKTVFIANHFSHNGAAPYEDMKARLPGFLVSYDGMEAEV